MTIPWNFAGSYNLEEWKEIIEDWENSKLSKNAYCKLKKIPYSSFRTWYLKVRPSDTLSCQELRERWEKIVRNWEKSGLSKSAYCKEKGLHISALCAREKKLNPHILRKTAHEIALEKWSPIVEDWRRSGLSKFMYARKHRLTHTPLCKWIKYFNENLQISPDLSTTRCKEDTPHIPIKLGSPHSAPLKETSSINQKIEIFLAQGEHFCLEGPFDWPKLMGWLMPLLRR